MFNALENWGVRQDLCKILYTWGAKLAIHDLPEWTVTEWDKHRRAIFPPKHGVWYRFPKDLAYVPYMRYVTANNWAERACLSLIHAEMVVPSDRSRTKIVSELIPSSPPSRPHKTQYEGSGENGCLHAIAFTSDCLADVTVIRNQFEVLPCQSGKTIKAVTSSFFVAGNHPFLRKPRKDLEV